MCPPANPNEIKDVNGYCEWYPDINRVRILPQTSTYNKGETTSKDLELLQLPLSCQSLLPCGYTEKKKMGLDIFKHDLHLGCD